MSSNRKNLFVLFGVMLSVASGSAVYLRIAGVGDDELRMLLRLTARISFMIYLLVFVARPVRQLFPSPLSTFLLRERRSLGIAFAAVHTVHLALIAYRFNAFPELEYGTAEAIIGGTAYLLMYLMLITSFNAPTRALGPKNWGRLHKTGLYYIGLIFVSTLLPEPGQPIFTFERAWFVVLTGGALFLRMTAYFASQKKKAGTAD